MVTLNVARGAAITVGLVGGMLYGFHLQSQMMEATEVSSTLFWWYLIVSLLPVSTLLSLSHTLYPPLNQLPLQKRIAARVDAEVDRVLAERTRKRDGGAAATSSGSSSSPSPKLE